MSVRRYNWDAEGRDSNALQSGEQRALHVVAHGTRPRAVRAGGRPARASWSLVRRVGAPEATRAAAHLSRGRAGRRDPHVHEQREHCGAGRGLFAG